MSATGDNNEGALHGAPFLVLTWAGLAGAVGVALSAVAAHKIDSPALATAATMLTLHAAAAIAVAAVGVRLPRSTLWSGAALLMLAAVSLFSGEIAFHTLTGNMSFQILAPIGGTLMILSWVAVAGLAITGWFQSR